MGKVGEGVRKNGRLRRKRRCGRWEMGKKEWKVKGEEKVGRGKKEWKVKEEKVWKVGEGGRKKEWKVKG